jgi:hypothetical protein
LAHSFAERAATSEDFELAASQVLPIINLRARATGLGPQELHALHSEIIYEVNRDGQRWISGAVVNGQSVICTMIISFLSEERHLRGWQTALQAARYACRLPSNSKEATLASL